MNVFVKIVAGLGAVIFTATAVGLPDLCGYCTARTMSVAAEPRVVAGSTGRHLEHTTQVSLRSICYQHLRLPI